MGRPNKMLVALNARARSDVSREFGADDFGPSKALTPEEELEQRRSELRNGLTDKQRLFLFGKLSALNDKDAATGPDTTRGSRNIAPKHAHDAGLRAAWRDRGANYRRTLEIQACRP
jgi:hypothetical protein